MQRHKIHKESIRKEKSLNMINSEKGEISVVNKSYNILLFWKI